MTTPSDSRFPFESNEQRVLDRTRREQQAPTPAGYESSAGELLTLPGDETAPYSHSLGRTSTDGVGTGTPNTIDGQPQRILVDEVGRVWTLPAPGGVTNVMGDIAHDAPDVITSFPVKVGGHANAGARADVGENDRVDASYDLAGRARVAISSPQGDANTGTINDIAAFSPAGAIVLATHDRELGLQSSAAVVTDANMSAIAGIRGLVSRASTATQGLFAVGNVAHDAVDSNNPVKVGGVAADPTTGLAVVSALLDRTNLAVDLSGRLIALVQGNVASDAVDAGFPAKIGGIAYTTSPAPVSADADRVNAIFDRSGRQQVALPQSLAGENLITNSLRTVRAKLAVQQESWLNFRLTAVTGAVIKGAPGRLARLVILNGSAVPFYVIVHDSTTYTVLGSILWEGWVPALAGVTPGIYEDDWESSDGIFCSIGVSVVVSTAVGAIVNAGGDVISGNALYF